jgi:hypothetical protein
MRTLGSSRGPWREKGIPAGRGRGRGIAREAQAWARFLTDWERDSKSPIEYFLWTVFSVIIKRIEKDR